ncbi:hypothetical protein [Methylobacterium soli]|uniref:hypothetical protein n=1 Tax=Methylobacterium soli TaxID=553447 RepID=UPI0017810C55|nr:hypothetical protein [Methylobacterium soli]GJE45212.1 hypothetical protein AEGHOMDF_4406 [Methylobacterium soli]
MIKAAVASLTRRLARPRAPMAGMQAMLTLVISLGRIRQDTAIAALAAFPLVLEAGFIAGAALTEDSGLPDLKIPGGPPTRSS